MSELAITKGPKPPTFKIVGHWTLLESTERIMCDCYAYPICEKDLREQKHVQCGIIGTG